MIKKLFRSRCEYVNTRSKPKNNLRRVLACLQRFFFYFINLGGFARSFRMLACAFRSLRRIWLVFALLAVPLVSNADAIDDKLTRIENSISNLASAVSMLQTQLGGLNNSVGSDLSTNVDDFNSVFNDFVTHWKAVIGPGPSNRNFSWAIGSIQTQITTLNTKSASMVSALNSISNQLSNVDFEALSDSVGMIEQIVGDIYMDVYEIKGILQSMLELQDEWSQTHTNLLDQILAKIDHLSSMVSNVWGGGGGDGSVRVEVEGTVDVGTIKVDSETLWDFSWGFTGSYLKYLDNVAGQKKWHNDFIDSESASIGNSGTDYREGVIAGFQNIFDIQAQQLQSSHRILLALNPTNDLSDVEDDYNDKSDEGQQETDRLVQEFKDASDEFLDFTWHDRVDEQIETAFGSILEYANAPAASVKFTVPGGECMGFKWETFTVDCDMILNQDVAEVIRVWILFFFYGGMIFVVLHVFPWGVVRFATIVYYLSNLNKNVGG